MTVFGKILVFLTLLMCLVVGGLCVFVYTSAMTTFATAQKDRENRLLAEASEKTWKETATKSQSDIDDFNKKLIVPGVNPADDVATKVRKNTESHNTKDELIKSLTAKLDESQKDLLVEKQKNAQNDAVETAQKKLNEQKQAELDRMKKSYDAEVLKNIELQKTTIKANQDRTQAQIQLIAVTDTNKGLEERMQDMIKEISRLRQQAASAGTSSTGTGVSVTVRNPPSIPLEGKVMEVGASGEQIEISIGSDAGLQTGHTLEVFRMSPKPQYLGYIRIIKVTPTAAVGQIIGKPVAPLQRGDNVASRILGG